MAELARSATVSQLRRVLGSYHFDEESPKPDKDEPVPPSRRGAPQRQLRPDRVGVVAAVGRATP